MHVHNAGERQLTELDYARLSKLDGGHLANAFSAADLVPSREIAADVVTMNTQAEIVYTDSGLRQTVTPCYPADVAPVMGLVSVLSPLGAALLGLRVGDVAVWQRPHGAERSARVARIVFQPEASGDYTT